MRRKDVEQWGVRAGHEKCIQSVDSDNSDARRISVEPTREGKRATGTYSTVHPRPNHLSRKSEGDVRQRQYTSKR